MNAGRFPSVMYGEGEGCCDVCRENVDCLYVPESVKNLEEGHYATEASGRIDMKQGPVLAGMGKQSCHETQRQRSCPRPGVPIPPVKVLRKLCRLYVWVWTCLFGLDQGRWRTKTREIRALTESTALVSSGVRCSNPVDGWEITEIYA